MIYDICNVVRVVMIESPPTLLNIISLETSFQPMNFWGVTQIKIITLSKRNIVSGAW